MKDVKQWVKENQFDPIGELDDYDILRFCRARKFVLSDVQAMMKNQFEWRKAEGVDNILNTFSFDEESQVKDIYPHGYHGTDKTGRPVYIERIGVLDMPKLWSVTTEERMVQHFIAEYEKLMKIRFPACSAEAGRKIQ